MTRAEEAALRAALAMMENGYHDYADAILAGSAGAAGMPYRTGLRAGRVRDTIHGIRAALATASDAAENDSGVAA